MEEREKSHMEDKKEKERKNKDINSQNLWSNTFCDDNCLSG